MKHLKKISLIFLISQILINNTQLYAQESTFLDKNVPAPFSGYLIPESKVIELRNNTLQRDELKSENTLKDSQIKLLSDQNKSLADTLNSTQNLGFWEKVLLVGGTMIFTGLAISVGSKITH